MRNVLALLMVTACSRVEREPQPPLLARIVGAVRSADAGPLPADAGLLPGDAAVAAAPPAPAPGPPPAFLITKDGVGPLAAGSDARLASLRQLLPGMRLAASDDPSGEASFTSDIDVFQHGELVLEIAIAHGHPTAVRALMHGAASAGGAHPGGLLRDLLNSGHAVRCRDVEAEEPFVSCVEDGVPSIMYWTFELERGGDLAKLLGRHRGGRIESIVWTAKP